MWLFKTYPSWAPIFARLTLGIIFFAHGSQKLLGWFGGPGWSGTIQFFEQGGVPPFLVILLMITEFFGGIAIILGFFTRLAALGLTIAMIVAIFKVHLQHGFFLNWMNAPNMGHGIEMNLALIGLSLSLLVWGGGNLSIDQAIVGGKK